MELLFFVLFGGVVGLIARALTPGRQNMGCFATAILGCTGSFVGGFLGNLVGGRDVFAITPAGFLGSVIGAMLVLFFLRKRGNH